MKYRKKPVVVEAIQFTRNNMMEVKQFINNKDCLFTTDRTPYGKCYCRFETLEGTITATEGDYIIKGVKGEFYPCKPDIFEQTYEMVGEE